MAAGLDPRTVYREADGTDRYAEAVKRTTSTYNQSDDNTPAIQPVRTRQLAASPAETHNRHDDWSASHDVRAQRLLLTVSEAAQQLGIGRSLLYALLAEGQVESIHVGRLRRIPIDALADYIDRQRCNTGKFADRAAQPHPKTGRAS